MADNGISCENCNTLCWTLLYLRWVTNTKITAGASWEPSLGAGFFNQHLAGSTFEVDLKGPKHAPFKFQEHKKMSAWWIDSNRGNESSSSTSHSLISIPHLHKSKKSQILTQAPWEGAILEGGAVSDQANPSGGGKEAPQRGGGMIPDPTSPKYQWGGAVSDQATQRGKGVRQRGGQAPVVDGKGREEEVARPHLRRSPLPPPHRPPPPPQRHGEGRVVTDSDFGEMGERKWEGREKIMTCLAPLLI